MSEHLTPLTYDKSEWGDGPWQHEPDRIEFEHEGLPCLMVRGPHGGWCGYVAVSPGHPDFEKDYDSVDVEAHGGLTYANHCEGHICHVPKPGEPDNVWWLGFDCAHAGDFSPKHDGRYRARNQERPYNHAEAVAANDWKFDCYRDESYVRAEVTRLAEQLKERATR